MRFHSGTVCGSRPRVRPSLRAGMRPGLRVGGAVLRRWGRHVGARRSADDGPAWHLQLSRAVGGGRRGRGRGRENYGGRGHWDYNRQWDNGGSQWERPQLQPLREREQPRRAERPRDRRDDSRRCHGCGSDRHFIKDCPNK